MSETRDGGSPLESVWVCGFSPRPALVEKEGRTARPDLRARDARHLFSLPLSSRLPVRALGSHHAFELLSLAYVVVLDTLLAPPSR